MALFGLGKSKDEIICQKCGATIAEGMIFCPYCGEKIEFPEVIEEVQEEGKFEASMFMHESDRKALKALKLNW